MSIIFTLAGMALCLRWGWMLRQWKYEKDAKSEALEVAITNTIDNPLEDTEAG